MDSSEGIIKVAIMAVGGQGGGVLTSWIADLATRGEYAVQMTSVAGVAQRTGATIYYVEMAPRTSQTPVFALSPSPGDIDILIAAELMEAGRAITRGFVSEDRTTLIASTHRIFAVSEKQVPGDGRAEVDVVLTRLESNALATECFDMQAIADECGSMISSSLFGALAKSRALPFDSELFEQVIKNSGRGVDNSLQAFRAALNHSPEKTDSPRESATAASQSSADAEGPDDALAAWSKLCDQVEQFPIPVRSMLRAGLQKTVDYLDTGYGEQYLIAVKIFTDQDSEQNNYELSINAAKYIANAMCYDDILRVADLKTRSTRNARVRNEQQADDELLQITEYFHPRAEEFCATLPARAGAWIESSPRLFKLTQKVLNKGRRVRTDTIMGFTMLWLVAGLRPHRRKLLRHRYEQEHLDRLLALTSKALQTDYQLAVEVLRCQRLIKGYSDTHSRGVSKFDRVISGIPELQSDIAPAEYHEKTTSRAAKALRHLRDVALADESGAGIAGAIATQK